MKTIKKMTIFAVMTALVCIVMLGCNSIKKIQVANLPNGEKIYQVAEKTEFPIMADHVKSIDSLINLGNYGFVNPSLTENSFLSKKGIWYGDTIIKKSAKLFFFHNRIHLKKAVKKMERNNYRPANLTELLSFGLKYQMYNTERPKRKDFISLVAVGTNEIFELNYFGNSQLDYHAIHGKLLRGKNYFLAIKRQ